MKNFLFLFASLVWACSKPVPRTQAQNEEASIRQVMSEQQNAWNRADKEAFMDGYWRSDSLRFIGSSGLTYGWQQTLDNYKKRYPDATAMGQLTFNLLSVEILSPESAFVVGQWHLKREQGDIGGHFTLLWRKIGGKWVVVADHTS